MIEIETKSSPPVERLRVGRSRRCDFGLAVVDHGVAPSVAAPWFSRVFNGIGRIEAFAAGVKRRLMWCVVTISKTLLRNTSLRFDKDRKFGKGAAMLAWFQIWVSFRTVILAAVATGVLLLPAQAAHANMAPTKAETGHAMMIAQNSGGHVHGQGVPDQPAEAGFDLAGDNDIQPGSHHDGQCCSGMCLSLALIESVPATVRARIGLIRNTAPMQLASADAPEFLRPPLV